MATRRQNNELQVVTFVEHPTVTIDEVAYPVSQIRVNLQENAVPSVDLTIDPAHRPGGDNQTATLATSYKMAELWDKLQLLVVDRDVRCSLAFKAISPVDDNEIQELDLQDWLLASAGIAGFSADGNFAVRIQLRHPAYKLEQSSMFVGNISKEIRTDYDFSASGFDNIVKGLKTTLQLLATDELRPDFSAQGVDSSVNGALIRLREVAADAFTTLEWDPTLYAAYGATYDDWPLSNQMDDFEPDFKNALAREVIGLTEFNPWELIAQRIVNSWFVTIVPTYTEATLKMVPSTPWQDWKYYIEDTDIADINFPGGDLREVAGVISGDWYSINAGATTYLDTAGSGESKNILQEAGYVCNAAISGTYGAAIQSLAVPQWFTKALASKAAFNLFTWLNEGATQRTPGNMGDTQDVIVVNGNVYAVDNDTYVSSIRLIAKQTFLGLFRQTVQAPIQLRLLIQVPTGTEAAATGAQEPLLPGFVYRLQTTPTVEVETSRPIMEMYVTQVVHVIDAQAATASTSLSGRYIRPEGGFPDIVVPPTGNPVWNGEAPPATNADGS